MQSTKLNDLLGRLNPHQLEAAKHVNGPMLVIASAGSGKTSVATTRFANLLSLGVKQHNICMVTFTNKAAGEMKHRISQATGVEKFSYVGTFHSICHLILRKTIGVLGKQTSNFTIYAGSDQEKLAGQVLKELNPGKDIKAKDILKFISKAKSKMETPSEVVALTSKDLVFQKAYALYETHLLRNNGLDFDDLLGYLVDVFKTDLPTLEYYQNLFKYIIVDEYQDTNTVQYALINLLSKGSNNLVVVGDSDQCLKFDTQINTDSGVKQIINIKIGDKVLTQKAGKLVYSLVTNKSVSNSQKIITVTTKSGKTLSLSPTHRCYASLPTYENGLTYVYLMYMPDLGYRIGLSRGGKKASFIARCQQEKATRAWLLGQYTEESVAYYYESYYSLKYQVPTLPFTLNGRELRIDIIGHFNLFNIFGSNGSELLASLGMKFEFPNYVAQNSTQSVNSNKNVHIIQNSTKQGSFVSFESNGERVRHTFSNFKDACNKAYEISKARNTTIVQKYSVSDRVTLPVILASQLMPTMSIPVLLDNEIVLDEIIDVSVSEEVTKVVDLEIEETGILIGNDIITHNSIYAFRAADIRNILNFTTDYPEAKVVKLEDNYRSRPEIIEVSNQLITRNSQRFDKDARPVRKSEDDEVELMEHYSNYEEAEAISRKIEYLRKTKGYKYGDFTILYRTRTQSTILESIFLRNSIPTQVVNGFSFFERKEVKDIVAYLKLIQNPNENISLQRIINVPKRGIGDTTLAKILKVAFDMGVSAYQLFIENPDLDLKRMGISLKTQEAVLDFIQILRELIKIKDYPVESLIDAIISKTGYAQVLVELHDGKTSSDGVDIDPETYVEQLKEIAIQTEPEDDQSQLEAFLAFSSLAAVTDSLTKDEKVKLMTIHAAKGLEFPVVFVAGMCEGILPHKNTEDLEEERRLAYVAMTRAQDMLFLSYPQTMHVFGEVKDYPPSRFLKEIYKT